MPAKKLSIGAMSKHKDIFSVQYFRMLGGLEVALRQALTLAYQYRGNFAALFLPLVLPVQRHSRGLSRRNVATQCDKCQFKCAAAAWPAFSGFCTGIAWSNSTSPLPTQLCSKLRRPLDLTKARSRKKLAATPFKEAAKKAQEGTSGTTGTCGCA